MLRRVTTAALAVALICTAGAASALAQTPAAHAGVAAAPPAAVSVPKAERSRGKLGDDFSRLVADAKAGKVGMAAHPRQQPAQSNNLSKGAKIAIVVVIAAVVITAAVIASKANDGPGSIRIF